MTTEDSKWRVVVYCENYDHAVVIARHIEHTRQADFREHKIGIDIRYDE